MTIKSGLSRRLALCAPLLSIATGAKAQPAYPSRAITLVVSFPAGGSSDVTARIVADGMARELGQPVVVENRPGGATVIGANAVARAPKDGHTLLFASTSALTTNPHLYASLPYKVSDFQPVSLVAVAPWIIAVSPAIPVRTLRELVAYAKARPGQMNYHFFGPGTGSHLFAEMVLQATGMQAEAVAYRGEAPALTALANGEIQFMPANISATLLEQHRAGRIRILAVADPARSPVAPDVPTFAEEGYPQVVADSWFGIAAPAGTPRPIVDRLHGALRAALASPELRARVEASGFTPRSSTPDELTALIAEQSRLWGDVIRRLGVRLEL
ncbi:tripartite tricarboxylate transporter substrate binding protein [Roseomonas sp. SSH11]|uniref:Tripartite tricarboxylate transporter substrate binding protein n=1 Tax=Pararoseomonas baculiformis TaxID=2820812 RepID=A0ABS4ALF4_9PROT|nr:tripartite tricarboxylate transporter substrate binding protein [Pararoseomonas baculiformis]MBP0447701.1 tripartite tricarboxylate transporter substrate binding protein [Pararoseomonas baculiformis]